MQKSSQSSSGSQPRNQRPLRRVRRKGAPPAKTQVALQKLATVVTQQHQMMSAMQKTPGGLAMYKGRSDLGDLGDGIDQSIRSIRRLLNTEVKCFQAAGALINPTTTGTITDFLSGISQGVTDITRVGDSLKVRRLTMNYNYSMNSAGVAEQSVWVAIIRANDEIMTAAQLNTLDANSYAYLGDLPWDYKGQYRVLWEKRHIADAEHQTFLGRVDLSLDDHAQYNAGGNTLNSGSIFMAMWSNTTTNNPSFFYVLGVEYVDT